MRKIIGKNEYKLRKIDTMNRKTRIGMHVDVEFSFNRSSMHLFSLLNKKKKIFIKDEIFKKSTFIFL